MADDDYTATALYRVVDRENQGWHPTAGPDGATVYAADYGFRRDLADRTYPSLMATRGPLRPVEPITGEDRAELARRFETAGRKTIATLAAALETVFHKIREERGGLSAHDSYEYARRTLIAGREGSWESEALIDVALFGNGLNLADAGRAGRNVAMRRILGPSKRVNVDVRARFAGMIYRWVTDPARYTEVAETLAFVVSSFCDEHGGWRAVADQWLQPGGLAKADISACYRLFYSQGDRFDSGVV